MKKFIEEILIGKNENFLEMLFFFFLFNKIDLKKGITKLKKTMKTKLILIRVLLLLFQNFLVQVLLLFYFKINYPQKNKFFQQIIAKLQSMYKTIFKIRKIKMQNNFLKNLNNLNRIKKLFLTNNKKIAQKYYNQQMKFLNI